MKAKAQALLDNTPEQINTIIGGDFTRDEIIEFFEDLQKKQDSLSSDNGELKEEALDNVAGGWWYYVAAAYVGFKIGDAINRWRGVY